MSLNLLQHCTYQIKFSLFNTLHRKIYEVKNIPHQSIVPTRMTDFDSGKLKSPHLVGDLNSKILQTAFYPK